MPRPRKPGAREPKRRSRTGCWPCKARKVKCGEEKPTCLNCQRQGEACDYSIRLNWEGRTRDKSISLTTSTFLVNAGAGPQAGQSPRPVPGFGRSSQVEALAPLNANFYSPPTPLDETRATPFQTSSSSPPYSTYPVQSTHLPPNGQPSRPSYSIDPYSVHSNGISPNRAEILNYGMLSNHAEFSTCGIASVSGTAHPREDHPNIPSTYPTDSSAYTLQSQRVSIQSLLSPSVTPRVSAPTSELIDYGYDDGRPDLDLARNDDFAAVDRVLPLRSSKTNPGVPAFAQAGYYAQAVQIRIPRDLTPLPSALYHNPINLMYFHHFINHTAKILVPHDCVNNPFATVLPAMAINCENVLSMLLAYSASHRARLLAHPEPYGRIALWTRHVFTNLRESLNYPKAQISDAALAAAIMLASLKITSPTTFEAPIPWQSHLKFARELFISRRKTQAGSACKVDYFLGQWLAYLDVFGGLSSRDTEPPLFGGNYWLSDVQKPDEYEIDCFTGFTHRGRMSFVRLVELIHESDVAVSHQESLFRRAERLLGEMRSMGSPEGKRRRRHHTNDETLVAMDEAYRLAGIVSLYRRVLGRSAVDAEVSETVDALIDALDKLPRGGPQEVCTLFPIFTAGCETTDRTKREEIRLRVKAFEGVGLKQIRKARKLMQRSWRENLPWTELANGEFLG